MYSGILPFTAVLRLFFTAVLRLFYCRFTSVLRLFTSVLRTPPLFYALRHCFTHCLPHCMPYYRTECRITALYAVLPHRYRIASLPHRYRIASLPHRYRITAQCPVLLPPSSQSYYRSVSLPLSLITVTLSLITVTLSLITAPHGLASLLQ